MITDTIKQLSETRDKMIADITAGHELRNKLSASLAQKQRELDAVNTAIAAISNVQPTAPAN